MMYRLTTTVVPRACVLAACTMAVLLSVGVARAQLRRGSAHDVMPVDDAGVVVSDVAVSREAFADMPDLPAELLDMLPERGREAITALLDYFDTMAGHDDNMDLSIRGNLFGSSPSAAEIGQAVATPIGKEAARLRLQQFRRLQGKARAEGPIRVIAEFDVPNIRVLTQAAIAARAGNVAAAADVQLRQAIQTIVQQEVGRLAGTAHRVLRTYDSIPFVALEASDAALVTLERSPAVLGITEDHLSPPMLNNSTGQIGADEAWDMGFEGTGQAVAILDSGVRTSHQMFAGKTIIQACFATAASGTGGDCPNGLASDTTSGDAARPYPNNFAGYDHGTHVAGIACGSAPDPGLNLRGRDLWKAQGLFGVARDADLVAVQVFHKRENSTSCGTPLPSDCVLSFSSDQAAALDFLFSIRNNINIAAANMSLGGGKYSDQTACDNDNSAVKTAIDNLRGVGTATVIASGNDGFCDGVSSPGCISSAVAVGAVDGSDGEASFSNFLGSLLELYAPGSQIRSAVASGDSDYGKKSGTSMATPHVCGAWAVMKESSPGASVDAVLQALQNTGASISGRCTGTPSQKRIQLDAAVFMHNGRLSSNGSGEVEADLFWTSVPGGFFSTRQFLDVAPHTVRDFYPRFVDIPVLTIELAIRNETGAAWSGYQIDLLGSDFVGLNRGSFRGPAARDIDPVVENLGFSDGDILFLDDRGEAGEISLAGSSIERHGENATLTIRFDDPVDPGEAFLLAYFVRDVGYRDVYFTLISTPIE
jgi:subtilisin family serine protease